MQAREKVNHCFSYVVEVKIKYVAVFVAFLSLFAKLYSEILYPIHFTLALGELVSCLVLILLLVNKVLVTLLRRALTLWLKMYLSSEI